MDATFSALEAYDENVFCFGPLIQAVKAEGSNLLTNEDKIRADVKERYKSMILYQSISNQKYQEVWNHVENHFLTPGESTFPVTREATQ
mmetsp:Transcript_21886/g.26806  ORF Transcript_21886/g.26806 Transcript_21886/m.26806 type:complete len:89 (+) Transcript_21886:280-546(+)